MGDMFNKIFFVALIVIVVGLVATTSFGISPPEVFRGLFGTAPRATPPPPPPGTSSDVSNLIHVTTLKPNDLIDTPLTVKGEARGTWFFEASFPVYIANASGKVLATGIAQAQSDWMTENFVPFTVTINFTSTGPASGVVLFKKDNPSGLPEHDAELAIPIRFAPPSAAGGDGEKMPPCQKTGCSGQVCSDHEVVTTCEYRVEYACYKTAKCERQVSGACGWTQTLQLEACLDKTPALE